tara:strand:+ start:7058 stop:7699 length:642 start_codon:yes stop_codon:yes gene_type:complete
MASVNINFNLGLKELVSDDTLLSKAVACSDILEQKIVLSTMRLLNKKSKSGKTKTSGSLAQGWKSVIVSPPKSSKVIFGVTNPVVYADIHNWGKQGLKSSRGKMLAIPLSKEAQTRGAPSHWGKNELRVVVNKKTGNVFLVKNTSKTTRKNRKNPSRKPRSSAKRPKKPDSKKPKFKAEFLLRKSVNIPATNYYDVAIRAAMEPMIEILEDVQ